MISHLREKEKFSDWFSRFFFRWILFGIFLFFSNCFEYEETIHFRKGFIGHVDISYTVPVHPKTEKSLIRFLPIHKEDIETRINKGFFNKNIVVRDFSMTIVDSDPNPWRGGASPGPTLFVRKAKVQYRVDFTDLGSLDGALLGYLLVKKKSNSISVRREFKSVLKAVDQDSSSGEKKIRAEMVRVLGEGFVLFKVEYPTGSDCRSNRGETFPGALVYKLPLVDTVEKPGIKSWDYSILIYP